MLFVVVSDSDVLLLLFPIGMRQGVEHIGANIIAIATFFEFWDFTSFHFLAQRGEYALVIYKCFTGLAVVGADDGLEYALGGLSNQIFASRYVLYMPNKEQLIK